MTDRAARTSDFLLEVRAEEIPARMLQPAIDELQSATLAELVRRDLTPDSIDTGYTCRRLWMVVRGLPGKEPDREVVEIGPPAAVAFGPDGQLTAAGQGFAKKVGVSPDSLRRRVFSKSETHFTDIVMGQKTIRPVQVKADGERIFAVRSYEGSETAAVMAELVPQYLARLTWAKSMRWSSAVGPWVRPIHGIVAVLSGEVVSFELFGVSSGRTTCGHPILSPEPFAVSGAEDYFARLAERGIVPSSETRMEALRQGMAARAAAAGGVLVDDPPLLAKLAAICEIPGVMEGSFAAELAELPREVLTASLRDHQSALTAERDGKLLPLFLTVMDRPDDPAGRVRAGNEWVVAARLADARFFWEKDRSRPLAERVDALAGLTFQERLGSYADKSSRLAALAGEIARALDLDGELDAAVRAAELAKVDLATEMVREFTSLQGVMGGLYARADGEPDAVWQAVYDQYLPSGAEDALPRGEAGRIVALADRIDTLAGFFGLGAKLWPSGSKDPFGLRRAALGIVRICLEPGFDLDLSFLLRRAAEGYPAGVLAHWNEALRVAAPIEGDPVGGPLIDFLLDRLGFLLAREGMAHDEIAAALGARGAGLHLGAIAARARAVRAVRGEKEFLAVTLAAKRIANILKVEPSRGVDPEALIEPAERALLAATTTFRQEVERALAAGAFEAGLRAVQPLAAPLDQFFDDVLVMDPDPRLRDNRLALLGEIRVLISRLADLSALVVEKAEYR